MIGLSSADDKLADNVRDGLSSYLSSRMRLGMYKAQSTSIPTDVVLVLFDEEHTATVRGFYAKKTPGILEKVLHRESYDAWVEEASMVRRLIGVEIETNHDFSGVLVRSSAISPEQLCVAIDETARELRLMLCKNPQLQEISIFSNATIAYKGRS